jgi:hypothetical protein
MRRTGLALLLCCWATVIYAQPELSITVMVRNPAPYALERWRSDPTIVQVTVSNLTSSSKRFVLDLSLQNQNTRQEVQTNEMHPCMPVFELAPGQTRTLNGPELICEPSLVYDATIRTQLITTGAIPEGEYRFCVRALDADSRSRELTSSGALCASTQVQWYDPPAIVRPVARDGGLRCDQAIVLNWQPPIPVPAPGSVVYRVRVVGMFEGQLPRQALEAATRSETVVDAEVSTTSYTIGANDPVMLDLLRRAAPRCIGFAWQVQALQATTRRPFPTRGGTQGKSTIETFTVECPGSTANMPEAPTPEQQLEQANQIFRSTVASEMQAAARQAGVKIRTDNFVAIPFDDSSMVFVNAMIEGADRVSIEQLAQGADILFIYSGAKLEHAKERPKREVDPGFYVVRISQNPASGQWLAQFKNLQGRVVLETEAIVEKPDSNAAKMQPMCTLGPKGELILFGEHDPFKNITLSVSSKSCPSCVRASFVSKSRTLREAAWQVVKEVAKEPVSIEQVVPVSLGPIPQPDQWVIYNCGTPQKPEWCKCELIMWHVWRCIGIHSRNTYWIITWGPSL